MKTCLIVGLVALLVPRAALADDAEDEKADDEAAPKAKSKDEDKSKEDDAPKSGDGEMVAVGKPAARMTMPGGKLLLDAIVETNLGKGAVGKPLSVAPDIWYGAGNKLTLGLIHSGRALTGFLAGSGRGLCFGDKDGACSLGLGKIYTSAGAEARIGLTEGGFPIALMLGGVVQAFKPKLVASAKVGFLMRAGSGKVSLELAPAVFAGATQRKVMGVGFNEDVLSFPVTIFLNVSPRFALAVQSGVTTTLEHAADTYVVPGAVGLAWWASPKFSLDLAFGLTALVDKNDMTKPFDGRSISVGVGYGM